MIKQLKKDELMSMKGWKGVYFDVETDVEKKGYFDHITRFGRRMKRDPKQHTRSYFSMTEKGVEKFFGASRIGTVEFPKGLKAAVEMCRKVSADNIYNVQKVLFGFDFSGGWSCEFIDHEMHYQNGPGALYEFETDTQGNMEEIYKIFQLFDCMEVFRTSNGFYCFKLAELDNGESLWSTINWGPTEESQERIREEAYAMEV